MDWNWDSVYITLVYKDYGKAWQWHSMAWVGVGSAERIVHDSSYMNRLLGRAIGTYFDVEDCIPNKL